MTKLGAFFASTLGRVILVGLIALAGWLIFTQLLSGKNAKTEARLGRNTTEAAQQSGADAVNTVGRAADREAASDALTRDSERDIRNAPGSDAAVSAEARSAGLTALCKRAAYRNDPRCR